MNESLKIRPWGLIVAAGSLASACTLSAFGGRLWWVFELTSHFRMQYAFFLLVLTGLLLLRKKWLPAAAFGGFALINCLIVIPQCWFGKPGQSPAVEPLRVL